MEPVQDTMVEKGDKKNRPSRRHLPRRWYVPAGFVVVAIIGAYLWYRQRVYTERLYTLSALEGNPVCRVEVGWPRKEVLARCGKASGQGMQPKVFSSEGGFFDLRICSAPGDVYGTKAVLYGCDGRVERVEPMPAQGFLEDP